MRAPSLSNDIKQIGVLTVHDHPLLRQRLAGLIADGRDMMALG